MSKNYLLIVVVLLGLLSCKKFDHQELSEQPSCDLCAFAESLNGSYRGLVIQNDVPDYLYYGTNYDSLTITVSHVFLDIDPYGDSLYMNFATTMEFDSIPGVMYDTIQIRSASGEVHNFDTYNGGGYFIFSDSIVLNQIGRFQTGPTQYMGYPKLKGTLYRQ